MKVQIVFENPLKEKLSVYIDGKNAYVREMEKKITFDLWKRGNWSVKERKVL